MSRKPSKKPFTRPSRTEAVANKPKAAIGQLESAILLWFNEADPISILVLASNAHDCYHALGKKVGKPSFHGEFVEKLARSEQERLRYIQDFAKHGFKDLNESATFDTIWAEGLMLISIECHYKVIGDLTPLMAFFWSRMCSDHPEWTGSPKAKQGVIDSSLINEIGKGSPKQCFERFMPELRALGFR